MSAMLEPLLDVLDLSKATEIEAILHAGFLGEPKRLKHILEVSRRVKESAEKLKESGHIPGIDPDEAYRAALLHDIGYLKPLNKIDFHPVDGANFLRKKKEDRLAELIECHSNSPEQAALKGLPEIQISEDPVAKLITYWDVQIKQGGERVSYEKRLEDIKDRYGKDSPVFQAHLQASPRIKEIIDTFDEMLRHPQQST